MQLFGRFLFLIALITLIASAPPALAVTCNGAAWCDSNGDVCASIYNDTVVPHCYDLYYNNVSIPCSEQFSSNPCGACPFSCPALTTCIFCTTPTVLCPAASSTINVSATCCGGCGSCTTANGSCP